MVMLVVPDPYSLIAVWVFDTTVELSMVIEVIFWLVVPKMVSELLPVTTLPSLMVIVWLLPFPFP